MRNLQQLSVISSPESISMTHCHVAQVMYYFLGRVIVLQPDPEVSFVRSEPGHLMLPPGPGLYTMGEPSLLAAAASAAASQLPAPQAAAVGPSTPLGANNISPKPAAVGRRGGAVMPAAAPAAVAAAKPAGLKGSAAAEPAALGPPAPTLLDAVMELLDHPHPLETLREPASYGDEGAISRYHNPDNYTKALGTVVRVRQRPWRGLLERGDRAAAELGQAQAGAASAAAAPAWLLPWRAGPVKVWPQQGRASGMQMGDGAP